MLIAGWIPKVRRLCEWAYVRLSQELYNCQVILAPRLVTSGRGSRRAIEILGEALNNRNGTLDERHPGRTRGLFTFRWSSYDSL